MLGADRRGLLLELIFVMQPTENWRCGDAVTLTQFVAVLCNIRSLLVELGGIQQLQFPLHQQQRSVDARERSSYPRETYGHFKFARSDALGAGGRA
jgi:hypothetical protein